MTTKSTRVLYHVTPTRNYHSIEELGISPQFCKTAKRGVFLVDWERTPWAVLHNMDKHALDMGDLWIYKCVVQKVSLIAQPTFGLFLHKSVIVPSSSQSVVNWWSNYNCHLQTVADKIQAGIERANKKRMSQTYDDIPF